MRYRDYQYLILCEDRAHFFFVRGWLLKKGAVDSKIIPYAHFPIKGDASNFVENNFIYAKISLRQKPPHTCLVAICDVDEEDVASLEGRLTVLDQEKIFLVLPKWSIETWCAFITDPSAEITEHSSLKRVGQHFKYGALGKSLAETDLSTQDFLSTCPPSLNSTISRIRNKKNKL